VPKKEIDELYLNSPYYLVPDGEVGQQAFAVIREAIRKEGMVALGRVVFTSREHVIAFRRPACQRRSSTDAEPVQHRTHVLAYYTPFGASSLLCWRIAAAVYSASILVQTSI
jgi:hypothetical protein